MKTEKQVETEILKSKWEVKAVKFMTGHDAPSMECSLYKEGKRVATVWDDSWGGGFQYTWIKKDMTKEFEGFSKTFITKSEDFNNGFVYNGDCVVDILVNHFEETKKLKKMCKNKTLVLLKGDKKEDGYRVIKHRFCKQIKEALVKKYGTEITILNENI